MKISELFQRAGRTALSALLLLGLNVQAAPVDYAGRGVFHFASEHGCPPGGSDIAQADCNRIALDLPDAHAARDAAGHIIVFSSAITHVEEVVVGDVLLQGSGVAEDGQRVPLSLHVLVRRKGSKWDLDSYVHASVSGKFSDVSLPPYQINVREGLNTRVLLTPERARRMFSDPPLARRLARSLVSVRTTHPGAATPDITVALGAGKLSTPVMRAGFTTTGPAAIGNVDHAFRNGDWAISLEALSSQIPTWVVQRELFLFGLDRHPALRALLKDGFKSRDTLTFGVQGGQGYVRLNGRQAPFDSAAASGHAFMQESFMGLILAWRRDAAAAAAGTTAHAAPAPVVPKT